MGCHSYLGDANQLPLSGSKARLILVRPNLNEWALKKKKKKWHIREMLSYWPWTKAKLLQEKESRGKDLWVEQSRPWLTASKETGTSVMLLRGDDSAKDDWALKSPPLATTLWHLEDGLSLLCCLKSKCQVWHSEVSLVTNKMTGQRAGVNSNGSPPGDYQVDRGSCNSLKSHNR